MNQSLATIVAVAFLMGDVGRVSLAAVPASPRMQHTSFRAWRAPGQQAPASPATRADSADHQFALHRKPDEVRGAGPGPFGGQSRLLGTRVSGPLVADGAMARRTSLFSGRNAPLRL
jgi:hypothetical protein